MSVRSMTGYARLRRILPGKGEVVISLKSVNHRGLDMHFHLPQELDSLEMEFRNLAKRRVGRGHIQVNVGLLRDGAVTTPGVNQPLLAGYVAAFREFAREHNLAGEPDLNALLRIPGVIGEAPDDEPAAELKVTLLNAFQDALAALDEFRTREGIELAREIRNLNAGIRTRVEQMEKIRAGAVPAFQVRLEERLAELLRGTAVALDPQRLLQEAAILADRSDVSEELARLRIHSLQVDELLAQGKEIGKKLDFLLQEMNREVNTTLSKSTAIGDCGRGITDLALSVKADVEKMREQGLNLE
jgi:uncharacterized protein (TIGR00255 family)